MGLRLAEERFPNSNCRESISSTALIAHCDTTAVALDILKWAIEVCRNVFFGKGVILKHMMAIIIMLYFRLESRL